MIDTFIESKFMDALLSFAKEHPILTAISNGIIGGIIGSVIAMIFK